MKAKHTESDVADVGRDRKIFSPRRLENHSESEAMKRSKDGVGKISGKMKSEESEC